MAELSIERLSLHLSGISEKDGRRLTRLIADGLAEASAPRSTADRDALRSSITPRAGSSLQQIADQIVADLLSQLQRSV
jgi:hypothetical protein